MVRCMWCVVWSWRVRLVGRSVGEQAASGTTACKAEGPRPELNVCRGACDPVTKPTASDGTMIVVRSSPSSSSMWTGPTRWAMTHSTYFLARLRSSSVPRISRVSECSKRSRSAPETRAIFSSARGFAHTKSGQSEGCQGLGVGGQVKAKGVLGEKLRLWGGAYWCGRPCRG